MPETLQTLPPVEPQQEAAPLPPPSTKDMPANDEWAIENSSPNLENTAEAPTEASAKEVQDAEARYTDTELLGKSFQVRRAVHEAGNQSVKAWEGLKAKVRNAIDSPGKAIKQFAYNRARNSHARKEARLNAATSGRLRERRQASLDKAKGRMDDRAASLQERTGRMDTRTKTVHENANNRHQEYIGALKNRRENALSRKAVREQLREEGASRREVRAIIAEMPKDHMDRIGKVAIVAETSHHHTTKAERVEDKEVKGQSKTEKNIGTTQERILGYSEEAARADKTVEDIVNIHLPEAEKQVNQLAAKLAATEKDSPDYAAVAAELQQAQESVTIYQQRELPYWTSVAASSRQKAGQAKARLDNLSQERLSRKESVTHAAERANTRRATREKHKSQLNQAVKAALNSNNEKRKDN